MFKDPIEIATLGFGFLAGLALVFFDFSVLLRGFGY